jgi:hypothetical protein
MKKNVASQLIGVQMTTAADGTDFTSAITCEVTIDGGTKTASGGTGPTHEGEGFFTYIPTQAETNGDHIAFSFAASGAISATVQVYTHFPQTVDNDVLAAGSVGFAAIAAFLDTEIAAILADTGELQTNQGDWATITGHATEAKQDTQKAETVLILADTADLQANQGAWATVTGHATEAKQDTQKAETALIVADTNELQVDWEDGGRIDLIQDIIAVDTTTDIPGLIATAQADLDTISDGIITGTAATGTLSTTACSSSLTGYTNDQLIGRVITFLAGPADGESSGITDYVATNGVITYDALTLAPENGNAFKIT